MYPVDMPYTLWHAGVLIGETDFDGGTNPRCPRQRGGVFRPSAYGREIFPRLTGIMTAGADLKDECKRLGLDADNLEPEVFQSTNAGRRILDIGKHLSEVEVRAPDGRRLEFASIAFIDLSELQRLTQRLGRGSASFAEAARDPRAPQYIVSATFRDSIA